MTDITCFRIQDMRDAGYIHTIEVSGSAGTVCCSCGAEYPNGGMVQYEGMAYPLMRHMCSHIDAVLIAGERAMVPMEDYAAADKAAAIIANSIPIILPDSWKGSWRRNLRWRGLSKQGRARRKATAAASPSGKPVVCFTGTLASPRSTLIEQATSAGWEAIDRPGKTMDVLVAADPTASSRKLQIARQLGIPIVSHEEWEMLMMDGVLPDEAPR